MDKFLYHSRHIPKEHLNFDTVSGQKVKGNLLCDAVEPENAAVLRESGVTIVETRIVWWELEPKPGVYDWSRLDTVLDQIESQGLEIGLFPWFMHPPKWEHTLVRAKCLEHGRESTIPSIWDNRLLEVYDRLYGALAERYGQRAKYLYFSIYGDFGEPQYPHDTKHYLFSSPDAHLGFWCGDELARGDFMRFLQNRYSTMEELNQAWDCNFSSWADDLMPKLPISVNSIRRRMDFRDWYIGSLMKFTDAVCKIIRKHFPHIYAGFPVGTLHESLEVGQIKSTAVKIAANYCDLIRWTGLINEPDYGVLDLTTQRIASAVRFYSKAKFGTEAALELNDRVAGHVIYANLASGSHVLHNDLTNIMRGWDLYQEWKEKLRELPVTTSNVLFYPLEGEQLLCMEPEDRNAHAAKSAIIANEAESVLENSITKEMYREAAQLREKCSYEVADSLMINDGFLYNKKDLYIVSRCPIPVDTALKIFEWIKEGGRLWYNESSAPWILETGEEWLKFANRNHFQITGEAVKVWPEFKPFASIRRKHTSRGETIYSALHGNLYSVYLPEKGYIDIRELNTL